MKALIIEDETAAARNLAAILRQEEPRWRSWRRWKASPRASNGCVRTPSPTCCSWTSTWPTAISFRISTPWRSLLRSSSPRPTNWYALEAFKVNSIDYLLKPLSTDDVRRASPTPCRLTPLHRAQRLRFACPHDGVRRHEDVLPGACADRIIPPARTDRLLLRLTRRSRPTATTARTIRWIRPSKRCRPCCPRPGISSGPTRQFIIARRAVKEIAVWFGSRLTLHSLRSKRPSGSSYPRHGPPNSRRAGSRFTLSNRRLTAPFCRFTRSSVPGFSFWLYSCTRPRKRDFRKRAIFYSDGQPTSESYEKKIFAAVTAPLPDGRKTSVFAQQQNKPRCP